LTRFLYRLLKYIITSIYQETMRIRVMTRFAGIILLFLFSLMEISHIHLKKVIIDRNTVLYILRLRNLAIQIITYKQWILLHRYIQVLCYKS
jgi:hypothetical protein